MCEVCSEKRTKGKRFDIVGAFGALERYLRQDGWAEKVVCLLLGSDVFDAMRISDKIKEALTLEKVVPADFVEYLETRAKSH